MSKRPNIVIINPDQMRQDSMAHTGNPASVTPNLDRLAQDGVSFSRAFCQNPVCTPSRCSFMSGWYPHVAGHRTMTHMLHPHEPVLLKELKDNGYRVWMNARNDLLPAQLPGYHKDYCTTYATPDTLPDGGRDQSWRGDPAGDNYYSFYRGCIPPDRDWDQQWTEKAVEFIREQDSSDPFCVFLPLMLPHPDYQVCEPYFSAIDRAKLPPRIHPPKDFAGKPKMLRELSRLQRLSGWDEARFDELRATYLGMCSRVDALVGMVVEALKQQGLYEDTAIFVFSDHGDYTGDYNLVEKVQNCFEDCLTNVPFLVKLPGEQQRHGVSDQLTELIDFYATAHQLAGLPDTHTHFGMSLVDYLQGRSDTLRSHVFCEGGFRRGEDHCKERGPTGKLDPSGLYYPRQSLQASDEMYNGMAVMCRSRTHKYVRRLYEQDELYDLVQDPQECNNQIDNPDYASVLAELKDRLLTHYLDSCDVVPFQKDLRMDPTMMSVLINNAKKESK